MAPDCVRIDRWLCAARVFKSRTLAQHACNAGHVQVNGISVKPSAPVRVGDEVAAQAPRGPLQLKVMALETKRQSPVRARQLFEDQFPPPPPRYEWFLPRARGSGRPTKADRRALERLRHRG